MITLYAFGPAWGLPDPSPFVVKAMTLLKMPGLPFETVRADVRKAPRGTLPYIKDGAEIISDSTMIRFHLERRHRIDFDEGLTPEQRGAAWAAEKLCEDHLYWLAMQARWIDGDNFERGPKKFFNVLPAPLRPVISRVVRGSVRKALHAQGAGRFTPEERAELAGRGFASLSAMLGDKPYFMGDKPCGADASVFATVSCALCPVFETPLRSNAEAYQNLRDYSARMMRQYFAEVT
jgi:glutathione S-transferase